MIHEEETRENDKLMQEMTRENEKLLQEMTRVNDKLMQEMKKPQSMFNCYQENNVNDKGTVTYSSCTVDTTDGKFNDM